MRKQDNPVFIFGALAAAVFLVLGLWIFFPGCNKVMGATPVAFQNEEAKNELPNFLVLSDIHLHSNLPQNQISLKEGDTGQDLWDSTQNKIRAVLAGEAGFSKPKFIVVLGDLPWHADASDAQQLLSAHDNIKTVLHDLRMLAENARIPLLYLPGNNDSWDGDYGQFSTQIFNLDDANKAHWPLINPVQLNGGEGAAVIADDKNIDKGYYSAYPLGKKAGLRIIALNTTLFVHRYADTVHQGEDAAQQMDWLAAQLKAAAKEKEHVLIAVHVPPGMDGYKKKDFWRGKLMYEGNKLQNAFLDLLDKYQTNIIGLVSSHTHMDGVRRLYSQNGKLTAVDISVPGITPGHGNNPGFKLISYNSQNFELMNFTTFYENFFPDQKVVSWGQESFDFRTEFGCPAAASIRQFLDTVNLNNLQKSVQNIYKVKNGLGKADEVSAAMDVRYE